MTRFRASLEYFLRSIASVRLPGGAEILTQPPAPPKEEANADTAYDDLSGAQRKLVNELLAKLAVQRARAESRQEQSEQTVRQLQWAALYWEFMYLSKFLVPKTQVLLRMLCNVQPPLTKTAFNLQWPSWQAGDLTEREAVFSALTTTGLVAEENSILKVTPKGDAFLQFLGGTLGGEPS